MDIPSPAATLRKRSAWQIQRAVLFALFMRELKARVGGRWMGALWIVMEPMAHIAFTMFIFIYVRHRLVPGMPVPLFLVTGVVPFIIFRNISLRMMGSVDANRGLFNYRQVKPIDPLLARAALETVIYSGIYVVFVAAMGWFFDMPWFPAQPLELLCVAVVLIALGLGLGLTLVVLTDDVPQVRTLIRVLFMPLYFMSGVIFPVRNLPTEAIDWLAWNPLLHLMELSRSFFAPQYPVIRQAELTYPAMVALVMLALGLTLYRLRRHRLLAR